MDDEVLCPLTSPYEPRTVEGLQVVACMSTSRHPLQETRRLDPRLLRHFTVIKLPSPQGEALKSIVHSALEVSSSFHAIVHCTSSLFQFVLVVLGKIH